MLFSEQIKLLDKREGRLKMCCVPGHNVQNE